MFHCILFEKVFPPPNPQGLAFLRSKQVVTLQTPAKKQSRPQGPSSLATAESCPLGSLYSPADFLSPLVAPGVTYGSLALSPSDSCPLHPSPMCDPQ